MARMVPVGEKRVTVREALAECTITMTAAARRAVLAGTKKGNVVEAARVAGLMAVKRTPDLLPFCHPIAVTGAEVEIAPADGDPRALVVRARVQARDRTGCEMEALTAAAVAALSIYDAAKAYDRRAEIGGLHLLEKRGGRSGTIRR